MPFTPHPALHPVFETLAYTVGYWSYRFQRRRAGDHLADATRWNVIAAAAVGALLGSRILGLAEELPRWLRDHSFRAHMLIKPGGKTIVGGLLGGWLAVELVKCLAGIRTRTGDLFTVPLCLGIAVGRIGCYFAGLADDTYGKPSMLPWAIDFGDGIPRHPTQLYELGFLLVLAFVLAQLQRRPHPNGLIFRLFLFAYLLWRLLIDFLKPQPLAAGLNVIQWSCLAALFWLACDLLKHSMSGEPPEPITQH